MKSIYIFVVAAALCAGTCLGADQSWIGKISDSMCGAHHQMAAAQKLSDADCTKACVKNGGKYVFVSRGKVYQIANQDFAGLPDHAGQSVSLTGEMKGDTITVSQISPHVRQHKGEKSSL
jgi:hypothetical protein